MASKIMIMMIMIAKSSSSAFQTHFTFRSREHLLQRYVGDGIFDE